MKQDLDRPRRLARSSALVLAALLAFCAAGCGGGNPSSAGVMPTATPEKRPDLTLNTIREVINHAWVDDVPAADGKGKPEDWAFESNEPKEIEIVEQKQEGDTATVLINIKTRSHPRARRQMSLEGQLRLQLKLESEFIFQEWRVRDVENISFKYTNLNPTPPPSPDPSKSPAPGPSAPKPPAPDSD
jgi:hypothetical protein